MSVHHINMEHIGSGSFDTGDFFAEAREILPIRVLAERWVDVYHTMVEASLPSIKGDSLSAKARTILADMQRRGAGLSSHAAVLDWLRVSEHRRLPPEQRRPHAPQRRREFDAFVAALRIDHTLAEKMWIEGIQQLRIDRRRAGQRMALRTRPPNMLTMSYEDKIANDLIVAGTPEYLVDRFDYFRRELGIGHLLLQGHESKMDHPTTMRSTIVWLRAPVPQPTSSQSLAWATASHSRKVRAIKRLQRPT